MVDGYIFCINSGRSGSNYLSYLLDSTAECRCYHERYPNFAGYAIQKMNSEGFENTIEFQRIKIKAILQEEIDKPIYGDTSHLFIKSWFVAAVNELSNIKVIWLKRNLDDIVKSMLRLNAIPDKTFKGQNWYLKSSYKYNLLKAQKSMTDKENCEWYAKEIEKRAEFFQEKYPHIPFYEIDLEDLNDKDKVFGFLKLLNLTPTAATEKLIGVKRNIKLPEKKYYMKKLLLN